MRYPMILRAGTWLVAVCAVVLAACDQVPTDSAALDGAEIAAAKTTDDVPEKTTGDVYARGGSGNLNHFVFNAHMGTDSKDAKGQYEFEAVDLGWSATGSVTYVESAAANSACFCGVITGSTDAPSGLRDFDGDGNTEFCVGVEDNGEPSTDEPVDLVEGAFEGLGPDRGEVSPFDGAGRCSFMRPYSNQAESGNVQVHDNK